MWEYERHEMKESGFYPCTHIKINVKWYCHIVWFSCLQYWLVKPENHCCWINRIRIIVPPVCRILEGSSNAARAPPWLVSFVVSMEMFLWSILNKPWIYYLTIIPRVRVGYELAIIILYPTKEWNNCFIKNTNKISKILPDFICKNNRFSACF